MTPDPTPSPGPGEPISEKPWRNDCWCRHYRKPCEYHQGYEDALDAAEAENTHRGGTDD
jgi:hypothetical protein